MSDAITENVLCVLEQSKDLAVHHGAVSMDAEKNYAIQQLYKNEMATKVAINNPVSVQNAILNLSSIGISLNPALKHAYLVPRDNAICLDVSYMGLMHLAQEIGSIQWGQAKIVYANDEYINMGLTEPPKHHFKAFGDRGDKIGAYCTVKLANGDYMTEEMSAEDILKVRNTSKSAKSAYSPWNTFEEEMWRKTVVKRASKYWPKSNNDTTKANRLDSAIEVINQHEGLENENDKHLSKVIELYEENAEPLVLWGYVEQFRHNEYLHQWLFSNLPEGHKTKIAKIINEGQKQYFAYKDILSGDDETAIEECKTELSDIEQQVIRKAMNGSLYA